MHQNRTTLCEIGLWVIAVGVMLTISLLILTTFTGCQSSLPDRQPIPEQYYGGQHQ